jgi:hypothetical protein
MRFDDFDDFDGFDGFDDFDGFFTLSDRMAFLSDTKWQFVSATYATSKTRISICRDIFGNPCMGFQIA